MLTIIAITLLKKENNNDNNEKINLKNIVF